ncbi:MULTISPECIES: transposase domain-containing protein [Halomonadaceae]|uniref:transposase domain-containing protein n=1 Tax=Halomonadaceae TaxID=28256 RepID=UPI0030FDDED4|nr:transposase domain-containing protein [Halomonas desiderata]
MCWCRACPGSVSSPGAKLNGHEPYTYLNGVLVRLPTQKDLIIQDPTASRG